MFSQTLRSGWLAAILTFFVCLEALAQTEPRAIVTFDPIPDARAVKYRVQTAIGSLPFATAVECAAIPVTTDGRIGCTVPAIAGTSTYKVRVAGLDAGGTEGEYSSEVTFLFASIQPLSPTSLSQASATSTTPGKLARKLSWPVVTKFRTGPAFPAGAVVEYRVYQGGTGQTPASNSNLVAISSTNSVTIQGLSKDMSYQFWVTCVVNGIESYTSPAVRVNT